jgi:YesN/AraC family two-component response regulator
MQNLKDIKILLVEDEKLIREGYKKLLELKGYSVSGATDGKQAIELMKNYPYDIIITDINMPEMDGIEMITELNKIGLIKKVIVITGYHDFIRDGLLHQLINAGIAGALHKPFTLSELLQEIEKLLQHEFQA